MNKCLVIWLYGYTFDLMKENGQKRRQRAYKVKDEFYQKALDRANKGEGSLANLLENVVIAYSFGMDIHATKKTNSNIEPNYRLDEIGSEAVIELNKKRKK